jgi:hypothetical protein
VESPILEKGTSNIVDIALAQKKVVAKVAGKASKLDVRSSSAPREPVLDVDALRITIARLRHFPDSVRESWHSRNDRSYRQITYDDICYGLDYSWTLVSWDWDEGHRNWEYKIATRDIEGDELILKIAVSMEMERIDVITKI